MANGFVSFLDKIGSDAKKVFGWLGSAKGQKTVQTAEGIVEAGAAIVAPSAAPEIDAAISLANTWIEKAITLQTVATAAGAQAGSGTQKASAVLTAIQPYIQQYEKAAGASPLTEAQTQAANDAIVAFLNALSAPGSATPAA